MKSKISVIIFLFTILIFPQEPVKIISSDFNSILIEFTPGYKKSEQVINSRKFINVDIDLGSIRSDNWGTPAIPEYGLNVGVPSETGNTIEVLNSVYTEVEGMITPVPKMLKDGELYRYEYELNENYYNYKSPEEIITFGEYGIVRNIKTQTIRILPVKFDPSSGKIKLYSKILFRINFTPSAVYRNAKKDDLVSGVVVNYEVAKQWNKERDKLSKRKAITNSVLAEGTWVRFETPAEGFYRITRSMLSSYGIDAGSVVPSTIKIYNNGGKMLPENAGAPRPVDLQENAIWVIGEEDGIFNENDYILFYGRGNSFWDYDTTSKTIKRYYHPYSKENYYWITSGGANGKRIQNKPAVITTPGYVQTSTKASADWEVDKINVGRTGRQFVGDAFSQSFSSRTYMNKLDFRIDAVPLEYRFRVVNSSLESTPLQFRVYENNIQIRSLSLGGPNDQYAGIPSIQNTTFTGSIPDNRSVLKFEILNPSILSTGYLDYFEIRYQKELKPTDNYLLFFSHDTTAVVEYHLSDFPNTNIRVFDVTDYSNVQSVVPISGWPSSGEFRFQSSEAEGHVARYLAVGEDNFKAPANPIRIDNSNIRGIADGAKFIILTHKDLLEAANRLKSYRENEAKIPISTIVVDVQQVFNEFSGGLLDVSGMRDFLKYAYNNWAIEPEYVFFFGVGTYDYKNIEGYDQNFVPTWQSEESLNLYDSRTSDDFFVYLDDINDNKIDLAPGRITVKSLAEAQSYVDKVIAYENKSDLGTWRNLVSLVADDAYTSEGPESNLHTPQSESFTHIMPDYVDFNKIYMVTYPVVFTGSGKRMPEVNKRIIESINNGTIIMNYVGHGNPELWAHEVVFDRSTIPQLHNENKYFFLIASTCSFGYFDKPNSRSAAEDLMMLPNSGTIAALTTSRLVFSTDNAALNRTFYNKLYNTQRDSLGYPVTIGKANYLTKNSSGIGEPKNVQKYYILGDPTIRLKFPRHPASIDSINGRSSAQSNIQLKALGKVTLNGEVKREDNSLWQDFNGEGILNVYDSERVERYQWREGNFFDNYIVPGGVIFRGRVSVTNGRYNAEFVVPKDISYEDKKGKIIFYFYSNNEDGLGFTDKIIVGGTDSTTSNDGTGPEIDIFFDDPSYINTFLVNPDSRLIVKLNDETGINTTGTGVGHQLEGILNDNETDPIDFSGYFTGELDAGGKSGEINYTFEGIETGEYKLDVKAWDVFNNFSKETAYFSVVTGDDLVIRDVYNYPNPFASNTTFTFQQNLNSNLDVEVKVYTIAGRLIRVIKRDNVSEKFVTIDWDGRDDDGDQLGNGTYLYKLKIVTSDGQFSKSILGKLAVIR